MFLLLFFPPPGATAWKIEMLRECVEIIGAFACSRGGLTYVDMFPSIPIGRGRVCRIERQNIWKTKYRVFFFFLTYIFPHFGGFFFPPGHRAGFKKRKRKRKRKPAGVCLYLRKGVCRLACREAQRTNPPAPHCRIQVK